MKELLFLSKGEDTSSTHYRALQFFRLFEEAGFKAHHITMAGRASNYLQALIAARSAHTVIVLRKTFPLPLLLLLRKNARRMIFDFDDAIFCKSNGAMSPGRMARFSAIVRRCDNIFAGNKYLAQTAAKFNHRVTLVPTCVDTHKYRIVKSKPKTTTDLVWLGSSSTRKYLEDVIPALMAAQQRVPNLRLKIIADFDLPGVGFQTLPIRWTANGEATELASANIGIAPMHTDNWTRGKCALKVLQYMAAGLPVVSSNVGVNAEIVQPGVNGELADTPDAWAEAIQRLASDRNLCDQYGNAGRQLVEEHYSLEVVFSRILNSLNAMI